MRPLEDVFAESIARPRLTAAAMSVFAGTALLLAALLTLGCLAHARDAGAAEAITLDFDASVVGTLPTGFSSTVTGGSGPASWMVVEDFTGEVGTAICKVRKGGWGC